MSVACPGEELLAQYLASTLAVSQRDELEAHLEKCDLCSTLVAALVGTTTSNSDSDPLHPLVELDIGAQIGRYVVMREINRGAMGVVYEAYDAELDRKIALKVIGESASGRARKEARAMASLSNPNVVAIHDLLLLGDATVIAMELVEGPTLRAWLRRQKRGLAQIRRVFAEAGMGLSAAHEIGIVHCDFKPDNVLLSADEVAKVGDFGLARWERDAQHSMGGTPGYMAPELLAGDVPSFASDQYSFALSFAEALLGKKITNIDDTFAKAPRGVPKSLWSILARSASAVPDARYGSMQELLTALDATLAKRRLPMVAVAAAALAGLWLINASIATTQESNPCARVDARMAEVWNAGSQRAFAKSLSAQETGKTLDSAKLAAAAAQDYARKWNLTHQAVCQATQEGSQSETLLDQRMTCLHHRLNSFAALVAGLSITSDVELAVTAFDGLPLATDCQRLDAPETQPALPASPELRARIEAHTSQLHTFRGDLLARNLDQVKTPLLAMQSSIDELAYDPLTAHYYHQLGIYFDVRGEYAKSIAHLERAAQAAALAHDDLRQAHVLTILIGLHGFRMGNIEQGKAWADAAKLAIERANAGDDVRRSYHHNLGMVLIAGGEYDQARASLEKALALVESQPGGPSHRLVSTLDAIGTTYYRQDQLDKARRFHERAIKIGEETLGKNHTGITSAVNNLGLVASKLGNYEEAIASYQRALDLSVQHSGERSPHVGMILTNIGQVHMESGDLDAAERDFDRAMPIMVENYGSDHPMIATVYSSKAALASEQGLTDKAIEFAEIALQTHRKLGENHPEVLDDHVNLAGLLCEAGREREAQSHWDAIIAKSATSADAAMWREEVQDAQRECGAGSDRHVRK